jgi:predicted ester cyclase
MKSSRLYLGCSFLLSAFLFGCGSAPDETATTTGGKGAGGNSSGVGGGGGAGGAYQPDPALEKKANRYSECLGFYNKQSWSDLKTCYSDTVIQEEPDTGSPPWKGATSAVGHLKLFASAFPDSTIEPQITLVTGNQVVGLNLLRGTNDGPLPGGPTTHKPIGYLIAHTLQLDDAGLITGEWIVYDHETLIGQLGLGPAPKRQLMMDGASDKPVELSGHADEAANLAAYEQTIAVFNAHDEKAFSAALAPDLVWSERSYPKDFSQADAIAKTTELWSGFSDLKRTMDRDFAAGDYVVGIGKLTGTNDGAVPSLKLDKTGRKLAVSFVEIVHLTAGKWDKSWLFYNGQAVESALHVTLK